ncbi:MAG: tRNA 2-thiouridine(34) synthase MnmA [Chloroflexi bacterium]|nr:MAG: tRNA 2-thiouridine(34) synthase MnmA [Chloroflexota bacterium]
MSGGVDSSVAAALLKEQGYSVIGMMMRLWSEPGSEEENRCCTPDAMAMARRVAAKLDIPFYAVDARDVFRENVVEYFIQEYGQGRTPNPCLVCNRQIRWDFLLERALALGADGMATGHYARLRTDEDGKVQLLKAVDEAKDQSYVLHVLTQDKIRKALFPLGEYAKPQIRELAREFKLPVANRAESQDLCFLGNGDYRGFLLRNAVEVSNPGPILTQEGQVVGEHQGLAFYTIGQRKGLGIASPEPFYVLEKDISKNVLVVGRKDALGKMELMASRVNWVSSEPPGGPFQAGIKIRYKALFAEGTVLPVGETEAVVRFDQPVMGITPGQAAVFYDGDVCLGGGIIS